MVEDWHGPVYAGAYNGTRRRFVPAAIKQEVLAAQENRCLYCGAEFGSIVRNRWGKLVQVRLQWDHFVPFEYLRANPKLNWIAACAGCNGAKGSLIFATVAAVQEYLRNLQPKRGRPAKVAGVAFISEPTVGDRPDWHAWVYGGSRNPALDLRG